jgi:hypothetical protein
MWPVQLVGPKRLTQLLSSNIVDNTKNMEAASTRGGLHVLLQLTIGLMKHHISLFILFATLLTSVQCAYCQHYDKHWMGWGLIYQPIFMGFEDDTISYEVTPDTSKIEFYNGITAISNEEGELRFYTNGNVVVSWDNSIMQGGKGFNEGSVSDDFGVNGSDTLWNYVYNPHTYRIIPDAYDDHIFYMVHSFILNGGDGDCYLYDVPKMQISKIDMSANEGRGKVVYKNRYFDEELMGPCFALVLHGNGRDWWLVRHSHDGLAYRSILLYRDTVVQVVLSEVSGLNSDWFSCEDWQTTSGNLLQASMGGDKLLDIYGVGWSKLLSFDRCSGQVSLIDTISTGITPMDWGNGLIVDCSINVHEFSPSGRYLYGAGYAEFAQWDLEADDIAASKVQLGGVPWWMDDNQEVMVNSVGGFTTFAHGPDGKIYNLHRYSHSVIEYPDQPGEASGLCLAADSPPSCLGVPYNLFSTPYPNYRLGPLTGSGCDTILSSAQPPMVGSGYGVVASPSVASGQVEVAITLPAYGISTAELQVVDMLGRVVYRHRMAPYAYLHVLEVSGWAAGLYNMVLLENGRARAAARLVVAR